MRILELRSLTSSAIEHEIDKKFGMSGSQVVEKLGLAGYNAECRAIVMRYADEWRKTISRLVSNTGNRYCSALICHARVGGWTSKMITKRWI